jgi:hypothetical protein
MKDQEIPKDIQKKILILSGPDAPSCSEGIKWYESNPPGHAKGTSMEVWVSGWRGTWKDFEMTLEITKVTVPTTTYSKCRLTIFNSKGSETPIYQGPAPMLAELAIDLDKDHENKWDNLRKADKERFRICLGLPKEEENFDV